MSGSVGRRSDLIGRSVVAPSGSVVAAWLLVRLLGVVYLGAFLSLWWQLDGLIGSRGVAPAAELLGTLSDRSPVERFWGLPTLCWVSASDGFLHGLCAAGVLLALLVVLGWLEVPALVGLWAAYLSLVNAGGVFFAYQWDNLLLEAGLLAIFLFPPGLRHRLGDHRPSPLGLWLLRWLLFRLFFLSGAVKLLSGDPAWRGLTALQHHFETQPLPSWIAWYAHQLPGWLLRLSTSAVLAIELVLPFFLFLPRRFRHAVLWPLAGLQVAIAATGSYAFFNLLTLALCLTLIDDGALPTGWRRFASLPESPRAATQRRAWTAGGVPLALLVALISGVQLLGALRLVASWPRPVAALYGAVAPFRSINPYGLFAVMTTRRDEIVIEGSDDRRRWVEYPFRWKPGDPLRRPPFAAPHQPRLDWQLWFAALGRPEQSPWLRGLVRGLAEGSPPVLALLDGNPFPERPPRYLRALRVRYRFTGYGERAWWSRQEVGVYLEAVRTDRVRSGRAFDPPSFDGPSADFRR